MSRFSVKNMNFKVIIIVLGIFFFYFIFGTLQEKLLKGVYGDGEKFTFVMPLLFITSVFSYLYTVLIKRIDPYTVDHPVPVGYTFTAALLSILAMSSSFLALQWVSYPAQVLAKSVKPIPVLIMGVLLGEKSYPARKYFFVCLIVAGVTAFFYNKDKAKDNSSQGFGVGELLLVLSLLMDGVMNALQERIMAKYKPKPNYLMMENAKWSVLLLGALILCSGEGVRCLAFIQTFPATISMIFGISICSALGQFFIYRGLIELGSLAVSIITTTRKFFTVLGSIFIFGHYVSLRQWVAIFCVFTGLILDTYFGKGRKIQEVKLKPAK